MAKTIKDMAKKFSANAVGTLLDPEGIEYGSIKELSRTCYALGANAVLDEISSYLPSTPSFNPNEVIDIIVSRIKELKGE